VARGLVAADEDQQRLHEQRLVVEALAVDLRVHEEAHQVVRGRLRAAVGHHAQAVLAVLHAGLHLRGQLLRVVAAEPAHQVVGPAQQALVTFGRDAEQVPDHDQRQPGRDVEDELALAALGHVVEDAGADLAHARLVGGDAPRGEAAVHQIAPHHVLRPVHGDHVRDRRGVGAVALAVAEDVGALRDGHDVRVAGHGPEVVLPVVVDGLVLAHPAQRVVEIARGVGVPGHEVDLRAVRAVDSADGGAHRASRRSFGSSSRRRTRPPSNDARLSASTRARYFE
jgi:hypothetical protein